MNDDDLRREVSRLREEVESLQRRLEEVERSIDGDADQPTAAESTDSGDDHPEVDEPARDGASEPDTVTDDGTDDHPDETGASAEPVPETEADDESAAASNSVGETEPGRDWELTVGIRWLGLVGALALVVGVVFFVRLAIDQGVLGPLGRVAVGTAGGLVLFAGGRYAADRQGYVRWGRIAAGAGLAITYFSLYAAYGFESYRTAIGTPLWAVLAALTLLVTVTAVVSVRDGAPLVVGEAFLLGYVTASLSTDAATLVVTPVYVLLLAGGLVAIAAVRPWSRPLVSSTFATYGVLGLWIADLDPPPAAIGVVAAAALLIYLLGSAVLRGSDRVGERRFQVQLVVLTAVNAVAAASLLELSLRDAFPEPDVAGLGTIAVAVVLVAAVAVADRRPVERDHAAAAGAVILLAAGLAMATGTFATTVAALVVVCSAIGLARTAAVPAFRIGAHLVAAALVAKLLVVDATALSSFDAGDPVATLTGRPVSFALAVGVFYALAWWFSTRDSSLTAAERGRGRGPPVTGLYAGAGTLLAVVAFALELSGGGISIAWALFGLALLAVGLVTERRGGRLLGIGVLVLTTAKVFLFDTSDLDTVARTLSFLVLGAVLLAASYSYARLQGETVLDLDLGGRNDE